MASLNEVCTALVATIRQYSSTPVFAYETISDAVQSPAIMAIPALGDFAVTMGSITAWQISLFILVNRGADTTFALQQLNSMIDGWGPNSVRQIVYQHDDLGLNDGTDAMVLEVGAYGGALEAANVPYVGALMRVRVLTDSTVMTTTLSDSDSVTGVSSAGNHVP